MTGASAGDGVNSPSSSSPKSARPRSLSRPPLRRLLWGPVTLVTYALLVIPFVAGVLETSWMTPLALPGYLIYVVGTAIGNAISPGLSLWVYWVPFFVGCYGVAIGVGYGSFVARR